MPQLRSDANCVQLSDYDKKRELSSRQQELILGHLDIATVQAKRHCKKGVDFVDLQQVAYMGLVSAARRYREEKGAFAAFASVTISGELKKYFRDYAWSIRPPRRIQELKSELAADVSNDRLNATSVNALADQHRASASEVTDALTSSSCYHADSLDAPTPFSESARVELISDGADEQARAEQVIDLRRGLASLRAGDRKLIGMRFFEQLTQQEIANRLGISQMQVSRRLNRLMTFLRTKLESDENLPTAS